MTNPTSNFGWQMPTSTDLVTDLPADFETFGQAVDTSLAELKGGTTGQVLSKTSNTDMDFTWVTSDDANAIQNTIVDAKGDLIAASASDVPARLAVGNNGEILIADSSTSTGLRWQGDYAAGKNKIINGDFRINQRAFTSTTTTGTYGMDRWRFVYSGGTTTFSTEAFTPGAAPVAGYEGTNYARLVTTGQSVSADRAFLSQRIESVRTFANQTVTFSLWAKAASGTPKINLTISQFFGTGGSPSTAVTTESTAQTISTSWVRYSFTVAVPSISGKTLGTAGDDHISFNIYVSDGGSYSTLVGAQNNTFDIWGVQAEAGSVATAFQTATGTIQGELAACQRYYTRQTSALSSFARFSTAAGAGASTYVFVPVPLPVQMRTRPTVIDYSTLSVADGAGAFITVTSAAIDQASETLINVTCNVASGLTQYRPYAIQINNSTNAYLGFGAEL
jgi:predicted secreted protein